MKVAVGLSGGVDSSVALALLQRGGYEVFGVTMKIWDTSYQFFTGGKKHACLCPNENEEIEIAKQVCDFLKIPHIVIDCSKEYKKKVLDYFVSEYINGRTPNPCVVCNTRIKFGFLIEATKKVISFDKFATGHYAKLSYQINFFGTGGSSNRWILSCHDSKKKDQSYFLCRLSQKQLSKCLFPLWNCDKDQVRELAREFKLPTSEIKDSQNFYSGDYRELIGKDAQDGALISFETNEVIGRHKGYWNYTIGQRVENEQRYVKDIQPDRNAVIVSSDINSVTRDSFFVNNLNFVSTDHIDEHDEFFVKVRSSGISHKCRVQPQTSMLWHTTVKMEDKTIITPGQFAVFYSKNRQLLFSGVIQ